MMFSFNRYLHSDFLEIELKKFLPDNSFARLLQQRIGLELHFRLVDWPDEEETVFSRRSPIEALFYWAKREGGLDPEWLSDDTGNYFADDGKPIPLSIPRIYSAAEQLAVYGLYLTNSEMMNCCGDIVEQGKNENGFFVSEALGHQAECLLLAYQALEYARKAKLDEPLTEAEIKKVEQAYHSHFSQKGGNGRAAKYALICKEAWRLARDNAPPSGVWQSRAQAVKAIKDAVIAFSITKDKPLSPDQAFDTIDGYLKIMPEANTLFTGKRTPSTSKDTPSTS